MLVHHKMEKFSCPECEYEMNAASSIEGIKEEPEEGDFSICINCYALARYDSELKLRGITNETINYLKNEEPEFWANIQMQINLLKMKGTHG